MDANSRIRPRCLFVETGASDFCDHRTTIDSIQVGLTRELYSGSQFVHQDQEEGGELDDFLLEAVRRSAEECSSLEGFHFVMGSKALAQGSALLNLIDEQIFGSRTSKLIHVLNDDNSHRASPQDQIGLLVGMSSLLDHGQPVVMLDQTPVERILKNRLRVDALAPQDVYDVVAHVVANETVTLRWEACCLSSLSDFKNSLTESRFVFLTSGFAPFWPIQQPGLGRSIDDFILADLMRSVWRPDGFLTNCDMSVGKMFGASVMFRGDLVPKDCGGDVCMVTKRSQVTMMNHASLRVRYGITYVPPPLWRPDLMSRNLRSLSVLAYGSFLRQSFMDCAQNARQIVRAKRFCGFQEADVFAALENVDSLCEAYSLEEYAEPSEEDLRNLTVDHQHGIY